MGFQKMNACLMDAVVADLLAHQQNHVVVAVAAFVVDESIVADLPDLGLLIERLGILPCPCCWHLCYSQLCSY